MQEAPSPRKSTGAVHVRVFLLTLRKRRFRPSESHDWLSYHAQSALKVRQANLATCAGAWKFLINDPLGYFQ